MYGKSSVEEILHMIFCAYESIGKLQEIFRLWKMYKKLWSSGAVKKDNDCRENKNLYIPGR